MKKKRATPYLDNKKFYAALKVFHADCQVAKKAKRPRPEIPPFIVECLMAIAFNLAKKGSFAGYSYNDDMIGDAIENLIKYVHVFDPAKGNNPHAFFTMSAKNAFIRRIDIEKKESHVKNKIRMNNITNHDPYDDYDDDDEYTGSAGNLNDLHSISEQISDFERRQEDKKKKRKKTDEQP